MAVDEKGIARSSPANSGSSAVRAPAAAKAGRVQMTASASSPAPLVSTRQRRHPGPRTAPGPSRQGAPRPAKRLLDAAHEHFHAPVDADEQAPARPGLVRCLCPASLRPPAPDDHAAVAAFHLPEPGHGGGQAEGFRVRRVDAADERLRDTLQDFLAQPSSHERCKALVVVMGAPGYQRFQRHAQLAAPGEHGTLQHRSDPRWGPSTGTPRGVAPARPGERCRVSNPLVAAQ